MINTDPNALGAALRAAITAAATHPQASQIFREAAQAAYHESGRGEREGLPHLLLIAASGSLQGAAEDHDDLATFYAGEADDPNSDHAPEDCREWSEVHEKARRLFRAYAGKVGTIRADLTTAAAALDL